MANYEEVLAKIQSASETIQSASGTAGALGATVGNFVSNYKAAKAGEATTARPINDIEVGLSGDTSKLIMAIIVVIVVGIGFSSVANNIGKK